jgi:hypothetical protein
MAGDDVFLEVALEGSSGAHYPPTSPVFKASALFPLGHPRPAIASSCPSIF